MFQGRAWLEKSVLPREGGYMDQHPLYVEAVGVIMAEEAAIMNEMKREGKKKSK